MIATHHATYSDYVAANNAKRAQVISENLWNNLKKDHIRVARMFAVDAARIRKSARDAIETGTVFDPLGLAIRHERKARAIEEFAATI
jgi:hypothetical protein